MTEEASRKGEQCARIKTPREDCGKGKCHVWQRIVKEYLQGMDDECVLHEIDHAVAKAGKAADACAVAIGEKEQRHHRPERDTAALRHMEQPQLVEYNRQREHESDIDEHTRGELDAAHMQIAEDEHENSEQCEEAGRLCQQF